MISNEQSLAPMRAVTKEEVEEIVKGLPRNKTPGLYGFTAEFYEATWPFMGEDIL